MKTLLITNGDSAAGLLKDAGVKADILPWRDCLHVGPVPQTKSDAELRKFRADFLSGMSGDPIEEIATELTGRDALISAHRDYERIELWFEHDLYDQLQLIQIVDMLARAGRRENIVLVQAPTYLGMQQPDNILRFNELAMTLNEAAIETATNVWNAFRQKSPEVFADLPHKKIAGFLFLPPAIKRMLEELPGDDGLSRTQRQMIYSINRGVARPGPLFARVLAMEEAAFWGDSGFFKVLSDLTFCETPLIQGTSEPFEQAILADGTRRKAFIQSPLELTDCARAILAGTQDFAAFNSVDFWWGGSHITNDQLWRWDAESTTLTPPSDAPHTLH